MKDGLLTEYMANQASSGDDPPEQAPGTTSPPDSTSAMLPQQRPRNAQAGQRGQMTAVWRHKLSNTEKEVLRQAPFPRLCIHGRQDIVAAPSRGEKVAEEIAATLVILEGAHFIPRERGHEVRPQPPPHPQVVGHVRQTTRPPRTGMLPAGAGCQLGHSGRGVCCGACCGGVCMLRARGPGACRVLPAGAQPVLGMGWWQWQRSAGVRPSLRRGMPYVAAPPQSRVQRRGCRVAVAPREVPAALHACGHRVRCC